MLSFPLGIYLEQELLGHGSSIFILLPLYEESLKKKKTQIHRNREYSGGYQQKAGGKMKVKVTKYYLYKMDKSRDLVLSLRHS